MSNSLHKTLHYDAFISYRHSELDKMVAEQLHKALETFKVPKSIAKNLLKKKITRVFRDRDELPSSSNLADNITAALESSEFLIVICSPRTPESQWVCKEIETFSQIHGHDKILALLIEGEPHESFPPALRYTKKQITNDTGELAEQLVEIEPLAADIRAKSKKEMLKLLKKEILRLLAALLHCKYDDLKQRHRERAMRKAVVFSFCLTLFFAVFGTISLYQGILIKEQMQKVLLTQSRYLADRSSQLLKQGDRKRAILVALEALPLNTEKPDKPYVEEAAFALSRALYTYKYDARFVSDLALNHPNSINFLKLSPNGLLAVTSCQDGYLYVWDTQKGITLGKIKTSSPYMSQDTFYFLNDSEFVYLDNSAICCVSTEDLSFKWIKDDIYSSELSLSSDKNLIAVFSSSTLMILNRTGTTILSLPFKADFDTYVSSLKFSPDGKHLLVSQAGGLVSVVDILQKTISSSFKTTYDTLVDCIFIDSSRIAAISNLVSLDNVLDKGKGFLEIIDIEKKAAVSSLAFNNGVISDLTYSPQTGQLLIIENEKINLVDPKTCEYIASFIHGDLVSDYQMINDILISGSHDGTIRFWFLDSKLEHDLSRISNLGRISSLEANKGILAASYTNGSKAYIFRMLEGSSIIRIPGHNEAVKSGEFSSDGTKCLTTTFNSGELNLWSAENQKLLTKLKLDEEIVAAHFITHSDSLSLLTASGELITASQVDMKSIKQTKLSGFTASHYSSDARLLGISFEDSIDVIDTLSHQRILHIPYDYFFGTLSFSQDHTKLLISADGSIKIYSLSDGQLLYNREDSSLNSAYLSPSGTVLALVYDNSSIELIDLSTKKQTASITDIALSLSIIIFSPDSSQLFVGLDNGTTKIYQTKEGKLITTLDDLDYPLTSCLFSKDGRYFVTLSGYNNALIWSSKNYKKLGEISYLLAINPSFTTMLTSHNTDVILMPYYTLDKLLSEAKQQLGDLKLTPDEKEKLFISEERYSKNVY